MSDDRAGSFLAAAVQLQSTSNQDENLSTSRRLIDRAAERGARLIVTPENTNFLGPHEAKVERAESLSGETCSLFAELARRHGATLVLGSFNERGDEPKRCHNTSVVFSPEGEILGVYRKIHLFDVDVSDEVRFTESATVKPGADIVCVPAPPARLGLTICYDLRFPEIYAALVREGAQVLTVPSAFTMMTGKDHWHVLLRARAIETQCFVIAPAQSGRHDDRGLRHSYGHSLIADPWGQILAEAPEGSGLAIAEIDPEATLRVRRAMPLAEHRRAAGLIATEAPPADRRRAG